MTAVSEPSELRIQESYDERTWERLADSERIIDLREWADTHGFEAPRSARFWVTSELLDWIEDIPWSALRTTSVEERMTDVLRAARDALDRARKDLRSESALGATATFGVMLPRIGCSKRYQVVKLHVTCPSRDLPRVTLATPGAFESNPVELLETIDRLEAPTGCQSWLDDSLAMSH